MLHLIKTFKGKVKVKSDSLCIDNWAFKLHYRVTTIIFFLSTVLVTSKEYIGESIKCITAKNTDRHYQKFLETFCFFKSTFTVMSDSDIDLHGVYDFYGLGSLSSGRGPRMIRKHMYYQWVPYVLFLQAVMFYATHYLWKIVEGGKIRKLQASVSLLERKLEEEHYSMKIIENKENCVEDLKDNFRMRIHLNQNWARWFIFFEILNLANVVFQIYLTNAFLDKQFFNLGIKFVNEGPNILERIFPKRTKCTFFQHGPSGTIEIVDSLCIMALNVINEKIYLFLWFWFVVLFTSSCVILVWRVITIKLYSKSIAFNNIAFGYIAQTRIKPSTFNTILNHSNYSDWLLLRYLSKNMEGFAFKNLFDLISKGVEKDKIEIISHKEKDVDCTFVLNE